MFHLNKKNKIHFFNLRKITTEHIKSTFPPPSPYHRMKKLEKRSCTLQKETQMFIFQKNSRLPWSLVAKGHNSWLSYVAKYYNVFVEITLK